MQRITQAIMLASIMLIGAVAGLQGAALALDDVVLADGTVLTSSLSARTITVLSNANVQYSASIVLEATDGITISGRLEGGSSAGTPFDIEIRSAKGITVAGSVVSASGADASDVNAAHSATGGPGADGGDILVQWGPLYTLTINNGAYIQSGDGGAGGDATASSTASSASDISSTGGKGGRGGHLTLDGTAAVFNGQLRVGNGGRGGNAHSAIDDNAVPVRTLDLVGTGGEGGEAGTLQLPSGYTILQLYDLGEVSGAAGGTGGAASSYPGTAAGEVGVLVSCPNSPGANGNDGTWYNGHYRGEGGQGCDGRTSQMTGGQGGCSHPTTIPCIVGGPGGSASGNGGHGGNGGNGADGESGAYISHPGGGHGGNAGSGGWALNQGGRGGNGLALGGKGGDASGNGGSGGEGGQGGDGGYSYQVQGDFQLNDCQEFSPFCFVGIEVAYKCGHIGFGGSGGSRGYSSNSPGSPGSSTTGLNNGAGTASGTNGNTGGSRGAGFYPFLCNHSPPHGHVW